MLHPRHLQLCGYRRDAQSPFLEVPRRGRFYHLSQQGDRGGRRGSLGVPEHPAAWTLPPVGFGLCPCSIINLSSLQNEHLPTGTVSWPDGPGLPSQAMPSDFAIRFRLVPDKLTTSWDSHSIAGGPFQPLLQTPTPSRGCPCLWPPGLCCLALNPTSLPCTCLPTWTMTPRKQDCAGSVFS